MSQRHHARSGSHGRKALSSPHTQRPASARPTMAAHKRNSSNNNSSHPSSRSSSRPAPSQRDKDSNADASVSDDDEESAMASFPNYCATCEKQIVTPGSSILYCSEACRRKDAFTPASYHCTPLATPPTPPFPPSSSYFDHHFSTDIVPQRSPTVLRPLSLNVSDLSLDQFSELTSGDPFGRTSRWDSDAARSLLQFYAHTPTNGPTRHSHRGSSDRTFSSANRSESTAIPSLVNSPSSSYSTPASTTPYHPRPFMPRHNPFSTTSFTSKSIDLVLPAYPPTAPSSPSAGGAVYARRSTSGLMLRHPEDSAASSQQRLKRASDTPKYSAEQIHDIEVALRDFRLRKELPAEKGEATSQLSSSATTTTSNTTATATIR